MNRFVCMSVFEQNQFNEFMEELPRSSSTAAL